MAKLNSMFIAAGLAVTASSAGHAQNVMNCVANVCQTGNGSISTGPVNGYSNGRQHYINGHEIHPDNPAPLTNPSWQPDPPRIRVIRPAISYSGPTEILPNDAVASSNDDPFAKLREMQARQYTLSYKLPTPVQVSFNNGAQVTLGEVKFVANEEGLIRAKSNITMAFVDIGYLPKSCTYKAANNFSECKPQIESALKRFVTEHPERIVLLSDGSVATSFDGTGTFNPRRDVVLAPY